jgi:TatD DNase family protein
MLKAAGLTDLVCVAEDAVDADRLEVLVARFATGAQPRLHLCIGLHPWKASLEALPGIISRIRSAHARGVLAGIGEIGLDFQPRIVAAVPREVQLAVFRAQVEVAVELDLPVNVHSTAAGHHALDVLRECGASRAVMHAFDGRTHYALQVVADPRLSHVYFSIPPCAVRSDKLAALAAKLPLDRLLLESDAPALAPVQVC